VLGHTGYIGSRLLRALQSEPDVPVEGRSVSDLDLTRIESVDALAPLIDADTAVVICAAVKKQLGDNPETFSKNLAITLNIGRALLSRPVRRIVFFSSAAVYGEDVAHDCITELTPVTPTSYYGIGKFAAERLLLKMAGRHSGTSLLALRPALVYGPNEPGYYYGPSGFLQKSLRGEPITMWGDGRELREFLYVDDVVEIARRLTFSERSGVLNVASGRSYSYLEALDAIAALLGKRPLVESQPRTQAKVDHQFDPAALNEACPGLKFTPLEQGLRQIAEQKSAPVEGLPA
jgi:UDP-glucose 4-epimerase